VSDLIRLAEAAARANVKLSLTDMAKVQTTDLIRIAKAGNGAVTFD